MSADATAALYTAIGDALLADATVSGHVATRVYAGWDAAGDTFPFIRVHVPSVEPYEADCIDGSLATVTVHVFARYGPVVAATIAAAVRDALHDTALTLAGADLLALDYLQTNHGAAPDDPGVYVSVVRFTAITTTTE